MYTCCIKKRVLCLCVLLCLLNIPIQAEAIQYVPDITISRGMFSRVNAMLALTEDENISSPKSLFEIFVLSRYEYFLFVLDEEIWSLWAGLSGRFERDMSSYTLSQVSPDPVFAFGAEVLSQVTKERTFTEYQHVNLTRILVLSREKMNVKLTRLSFQQLREDGVPEKILEELQPLEEYEFTQEDVFEQALADRIGTEQLIKYKSLIYKRTDTLSSQTGLMSTSHDMNSWNTQLNTKVNLESWNAFLYYPKKMKNALSYQGNRKNTTFPPGSKDEQDDFLFDVLAFLKKWGVPTPLTVVLIILLIYLTLSFLVRNR